jgi:hypothetical protein
MILAGFAVLSFVIGWTVNEKIVNGIADDGQSSR